MTPRLVQLKRFVANILQSYPIGHSIGRFYGDVIPFHGVPIDVRETGIPAANKAALRLGMYESAEYRFIKAFLRPDLPVIELGSSIGAISSAIAGQLVPGQRLICVEANPVLIPALRRNMDQNAAHLAVEVIHAAVSYDGSSVEFNISHDNLASAVSADSASQTTTVPSVTLGTLVAKAAGVPFQLVADIEGAELALLTHDAESLRLCRLLIIELHHTVGSGRAYAPSDLKHLLKQCGFTVVAHYGNVVVCSSLEAGPTKSPAKGHLIQSSTLPSEHAG